MPEFTRVTYGDILTLGFMNVGYRYNMFICMYLCIYISDYLSALGQLCMRTRSVHQVSKYHLAIKL